MRITNRNQIMSQMRNMNKTLGNLTNSNNRLASQRKFDHAYENVADATRAMRLRKSLRDKDFYTTNVRDARGRINSAEDALQTSITVLRNVTDRVEQALNGTYAEDDRKKIATEISNLQEEVLALMNSTYTDNYVFGAAGGPVKGEAPFIIDNAEVPVFETVKIQETVDVPDYKTVITDYTVGDPPPAVYDADGNQILKGTRVPATQDVYYQNSISTNVTMANHPQSFTPQKYAAKTNLYQAGGVPITAGEIVMSDGEYYTDVACTNRATYPADFKPGTYAVKGTSVYDDNGDLVAPGTEVDYNKPLYADATQNTPLTPETDTGNFAPSPYVFKGGMYVYKSSGTPYSVGEVISYNSVVLRHASTAKPMDVGAPLFTPNYGDVQIGTERQNVYQVADNNTHEVYRADGTKLAPGTKVSAVDEPLYSRDITGLTNPDPFEISANDPDYFEKSMQEITRQKTKDKVDADGNKVQLLDAEGLPVYDEGGNPIFEQEGVFETRETLAYHRMPVDEITYNKETGKMEWYLFDKNNVVIMDPNTGEPMRGEIKYNAENYLDIGVGHTFLNSPDGPVINPQTVHQYTLSGIEVFGVGVDENGMSNNLYSFLGEVVQSLNDNDMDTLGMQFDHIKDIRATLLTSMTEIGVRNNFLDDIEAIHKNDTLNFQTRQRDIEAVDLAEEVMYNKNHEMAWMVTLQMGSKVLPSSLFDFVK